jgi:hypothetical protein
VPTNIAISRESIRQYTSGSSLDPEAVLKKRKRRAVLAKKGVLLQGFYTRRELARALGFSVVTISRMDGSGTGPPSIKLAGVRLYKKTAVQQWIERVTLEAEASTASKPPKKSK